MISWRPLGEFLGTLQCLGAILAALGQLSGPSQDPLGSVLETPGIILELYVGVLLEVRRHLEHLSKVIFANIAKPSKTLKGISKMEVPRSRNI